MQISKLSLSFDVVDITHQLVARWSSPIAATSVETLRTYLQQPLKEEEKIPISQKCFNELCVPYSIWPPGNDLSAEQLSTLFRVSADEHASETCDSQTPYDTPPRRTVQKTSFVQPGTEIFQTLSISSSRTQHLFATATKILA